MLGLSEGTYYFAATALDKNENKSAYSNEVSKTVASVVEINQKRSSSPWFCGRTSLARPLERFKNACSTSLAETPCLLWSLSRMSG